MKYPYKESDIIESDGFEITEYINRDLMRKSKKANSSECLIKIKSIVQEHNFSEICRLDDFISNNYPDLVDTLNNNYYIIRTYISSRASAGMVEEWQKNSYEKIQDAFQSKLDARDTIIASYESLVNRLIKTDSDNEEFEKLIEEYSILCLNGVDYFDIPY